MVTNDANRSKTLSQRLKDARAAHRKRHSPSGLRFVIADSIDLIQGQAWDELTANSSLFLSRKYLRVLEAAGPENVIGRYAMAFSGKKPVAAIATQLVELDGRKLVRQSNEQPAEPSERKLRSFLKRVGKSAKLAAVAKLRGRVLVCGNLQSWGQHAVAFSDDTSAEVRWTAVAEALYRIRRAERLSGQTDVVMVKDFSIADQCEMSHLETFDYRPVETDPNMVLEIPDNWKSFDDYLNSLASKYRSGARKIVKDVAAAGLKTELFTDWKNHGDRLHELYQNVHQKAAVRPVTLAVDYLPAIAAQFGSAFRCTVARRGEEIVGFITSLKDGETSVGYYIGFDYGVNEECPLYFRLLQICIDDAIQFGCRRVSYGRTALDPKARMGAKPEAMKIWVRHRQPVINWMIRGLLGAIPHDEAPERNPFKGS